KTRNVFVVLNAGKDDHQIAETCIGYPHFLSCDFVVASIFRKYCFSFSAIGITSGSRFSQGIGTKPFPSSKFGNKFLLLLLGSIQGNRKCSNSRMSPESSTKRTSSSGNIIDYQHCGDKAHSQAAEFLGN